MFFDKSILHHSVFDMENIEQCTLQYLPILFSRIFLDFLVKTDCLARLALGVIVS